MLKKFSGVAAKPDAHLGLDRSMRAGATLAGAADRVIPPPRPSLHRMAVPLRGEAMALVARDTLRA